MLDDKDIDELATTIAKKINEPDRLWTAEVAGCKGWNAISVISALVLVAALTGCESMPRGELAFQALHAVDVAQTINGPARDPCFKEADPITRRIIGEQPSTGQVLAWGVGKSVLHYGVSRYLEDNHSDWVLGAWQLFTTGSVALTIRDNHRIGIRPWGDNDYSSHSDPRGCEYWAGR